MKFLYHVENPKLINSVEPLPYIRIDEINIDRKKMADFFFLSKHKDEILGITEVDRISTVDQIHNIVNARNNDEFEFSRLSHWEKNFANVYDQQSWDHLLNNNLFADSVAKIFWLCDHLRNNGRIDFPITQAWNRYYDAWEITVGNSRIVPLRLFCHTRTIKVITFKTRYCKRPVEFEKEFDSFESLEKYFKYPASINYRAWGGSLIPAVHFHNKDGYLLSKLQFQNKLARYFIQQGNTLGINRDKNLHWNINKILDGMNALD